MSQITPVNKPTPGITNHSVFARVYDRLSRSAAESSFMHPLRRETAGKATGLVLEVGVGTGLNFSFYEPGQVERVEAIEPDTAMLGYAHKRIEAAHVPITLTQAPAEALPFADETFDCAVATLVFCSVTDPVQGLREIKRVLKPGGLLFMVEHVRASGRFAAGVQGLLVPVTTRLSGNCHWNRDTARTVADAGFQITSKRHIQGRFMPIIMLQATRSRRPRPTLI